MLTFLQIEEVVIKIQQRAVAIGLRKEMDAQCVDAGLNKY
jgi:hypothetical protein